MPSSSCVVEPLPFSLHVFLVQPYVALWRPLFTFPFWLAALAAECIVLDGCQHTLWSVFPVLYLMTWKQLKKHRCFSVGWAGRCSVYRSNLLVGFLPFSVAFEISSIETTEYGRLFFFVCFFASCKQSKEVDMHQLFQHVFGSPSLCILAFLLCKEKKYWYLLSLFLRTLGSGF